MVSRGWVGVLLTASCGLLLFVSDSKESFAQGTADSAESGRVVGTGALTVFVEDMDRSLAFYHDAFGMEVPPLPESGARPYNPSNAQLFAMFDIHGAKERHQSARFAGSEARLEFMEVQNVEHRTVPLRLQDPGAMTLVFLVADVAKALGQATNAGALVITPGAMAVPQADGSRSVMIRDPDGRFVELRETMAAPDAPAGGVTEIRPSIAVADMEHALEVYGRVLGFEVERLEMPAPSPQLRALTGLATAEFQRARVRAPGSALWIEFVEYDGVDRQPLAMRIQDRGAARLQIRAENLEPLVRTMREAGMKVVSDGGRPVPIPPNFLGALVADPNNFFLTPFAPCDGCAPGLVSE